MPCWFLYYLIFFGNKRGIRESDENRAECEISPPPPPSLPDPVFKLMYLVLLPLQLNKKMMKLFCKSCMCFIRWYFTKLPGKWLSSKHVSFEHVILLLLYAPRSRNPSFPQTVRESKSNNNVQILLCKTRKTIGSMSKLRVRGSVWLITPEGVPHIWCIKVICLAYIISVNTTADSMLACCYVFRLSKLLFVRC